MYSLSSCWNSHRHTDGRAMLREIRELGFDYAELSHGIRISLLPGIFEAVDAGEIKISSVHNFCPLPIGVHHANPNIFEFSSTDARERDNAFRHSIKTLDTAVRVGAKAVVLHLGSIDMKDYTDKLLRLVGEGQHLSAKYEKLCAEAVDKREQKKERYARLAYDLLQTLAGEAASRGLKLGIENREALEEIPFESDFPALFKEIHSDAVGYWHDTGHAQIKENLGFINHASHLAGLADRLIGLHIHDVEFPGADHRPPGSGCIDFPALKSFIQPHHIKILELSPNVLTDAVVPSWEWLRNIWGPE